MQFSISEQIYQRKLQLFFGVFVKLHNRLIMKNVHTLILKQFISFVFCEFSVCRIQPTEQIFSTLTFAYILSF